MDSGDRIKVILADGEREGVLVPSLGTDKETLILKLDNGYNVGIDRSKIKKTVLISKYKKKKITVEKVNQKKLPKISILSTGGTISSKVDYRTGGVYADYTAEDFLMLCPELASIASIHTKKIASVMSEDILPDDWAGFARDVKKEIDAGARGIVITHGTDTMHFTAAALSFMLEDLHVPVILTGSQRSIDRGSSDAFMNLICSVKAAVSYAGAGVMTCMHGNSDDDYCLLIRGTKVRKMDTSRRDAFRPINDLPLAKVYTDRLENIQAPSKGEKLKLSTKFEDSIAIIYIYPGLDPEILEFYLKKNIKGLVIAATALGHVNTWTKKSLLPGLKKFREKDIPVFITSQTLYGRVDPYVYTNLRKLSGEVECIFLKDMMPETAYIKLGWVLGQQKKYEKVKDMMLRNYRGEYSEKLIPDMFLY